MASKITITDTKNKVTIIPSSSNKVETSITNTPVTVTQGTTSVVTVNTLGPQGPQGNPGESPGFDDDIQVRHITASGNISASGDIIGKDIFGQTLFTDFGLFLRNSSLSDLAIQNETNATGFIRFLTKREDTQVERLRISNNGNVGIGTTAPIQKLDIIGDARATNFRVDSTNKYIIGNGNQYMTGTNDTALELYSGGSSRVYISSSGNVGIGTSTPSFALDITGSLSNTNQGGVVRFESSGSGDLIFNDGCEGSNETAIQFGNNGRISGEGGDFNFSSAGNNVLFHTGSGIRNITTPALTISSSGQIKLDYDNMPTSNPNEKGVIYRSSSNGMDNLLFISPG